MEKLKNRLVIDVESTALTARDKELLTLSPVGGVILFARNYESPEQLKALTDSIRAIRKELIIFVDQEGGRVQRFRQGFSLLPAAASYGALYEEEPERATRFLRGISALGISELLEAGVDCNFAPVLDIDRGLNSVIGNRAYHQDSAAIIILAKTYIDSARHLGMSAVAKHFPGHGGVAEDTHSSKANDPRDFETLWLEDLAPFRALASDIGGVMTTHVQFPNVDDKAPTFSNIWLRRILRDELKFEGVVFSDDLTMHGAHFGTNLAERCLSAFRAGVDVAIMCNDFTAIDEAVEALTLRCDMPSDNVSIELMRADWQRYHKVRPMLRSVLAQAQQDISDLA